MEVTPHSFSILIVDDDEGQVELVRRNMRRIAVINPIIIVNDGQQALDFIFRRGEFSGRSALEHNPLVLLDINMPGSMNGVEVLRQIKADPATRTTPIIMLSTIDEPREVAHCYELGCSAYITKPVDPLQFIETIRRLGFFLQVISLPDDEHPAAESPT